MVSIGERPGANLVAATRTLHSVGMDLTLLTLYDATTVYKLQGRSVGRRSCMRSGTDWPSLTLLLHTLVAGTASDSSSH